MWTKPNLLAGNGSVLVIILVCFLKQCQSVPVEQDLSLTLAEKNALDQFKKMMTTTVPHDYMRQDVYLIRWLRELYERQVIDMNEEALSNFRKSTRLTVHDAIDTKSLDVYAAQRMLDNHLKWRADNHIDAVLKEDFTAFNESYPIYEGEDYEGRPVLAGDAGEWDVRRGILSGNRNKGERHVYRAIEHAYEKVREKQARGENVTRFQAIFDLKGFNLVQHACLGCVPMYVNILLSFQDHYPYLADNVIIVNAPDFFRVVLDILRPFAQPPLRGLVKRFGTNKEEWRKFILDLIPPDQLPTTLGGTREA